MKRILCYGDSNTYGANPAWSPYLSEDEPIPTRFGEDIRWTKLLQKLLGEDQCEIIEEGLCGRTTIYKDPAWPYCEGRSYLTPCLLSHLPLDLIVVMLGSNDMKEIFAPCPDSASLAMDEFLKTLRNPFLYEGWTMPKILLVSPVFLGENLETSYMYGGFTERGRDVSKQLPEIYAALAKKHGCEFLAASDFASPSPKDSVHMDEAEHKKLAKALAEKIRKILAL